MKIAKKQTVSLKSLICESGGMADALDLESSGVKPVRVQIPPLAYIPQIYQNVK